jgi:hypothetical protein
MVTTYAPLLLCVFYIAENWESTPMAALTIPSRSPTTFLTLF